MYEMKQKLIEILKTLGIFPKSGFGEILIKFESFNIVAVKVTESKKI